MNKLEISKELLSEVLTTKVLEHSAFNKHTNSINIQYVPDEDSLQPDWKPINIYKLSHKCKEWARNKNYFLETRLLYPFNIFRCIIFSSLDKRWNKLVYNDEHNKSETEPESIFKACEWILKEKGENKYEKMDY